MVIHQNILSAEKALWERLSRFGLNPTDWIVRKLKEGIFYAVHRAEPTWVLIGQAKKSSFSWDWHSLELCEISSD